MAFIAFATVARPLAAQQASHEVTPQQVRSAIDKGVAFLKGAQNNDGNWPGFTGYDGGTTALATLALLTAGVPVDDPQMRSALTKVRAIDSDKTYVIALQTMALCQAEPKKDLLLIRRNVNKLEGLQNADGPKKGAWPYSEKIPGGDNSNSQFAVLALYEAERAGVPVRPQTWTLALQYWLAGQNDDGSWGYYPVPGRQPPGSGSMTSAGITSVVIASGRLNSGDADVVGGTLKCCGQQEENKAVNAIQNGLSWIGNNFSVYNNPGSPAGWLMYYLYGTERVGRLTSQRFFFRKDGQRYDWYRMGAEMLVQKQDGISGFWKGDNHVEDNKIISTSFALLFLAKGRRPILVSKAQFGDGDDWQRHRGDLANLTSYVEKRWQKDFPLGLSWQVVNIANASVEDLLQTPVLYISASQAPDLMNQAQKLRDYIDRGGFIFAEACCPNSAGFDAGFRALMEKVFVEPEYRLKPLAPEHPIWNAEEPVRPALRPNVWNIDYGCRTSVVYVAPPEPGDLPNSLSCYWEIASGRDRKLPAQLQEQLDAALSLGINVLAYATNRELKSKDENFQLPDAAVPVETVDRALRRVAKLRHPGGCDAAPGALPSLLRAYARELKARVDPRQQQITMTDPALFDFDTLFMHGRHNFRLTDAERKQMKLYLERGTLIADSICASRDFTTAFRREINALFADEGIKLEAIPVDHEMFTDKFGGFDLSQVSRREPQLRGDGGPLEARVRKGPPELKGLKIGDRYAVIFSPYDLSCALEKHDSLECAGYTREDAERIGLNLLLYSLFEF